MSLEQRVAPALLSGQNSLKVTMPKLVPAEEGFVQAAARLPGQEPESPRPTPSVPGLERTELKFKIPVAYDGMTPEDAAKQGISVMETAGKLAVGITKNGKTVAIDIPQHATALEIQRSGLDTIFRVITSLGRSEHDIAETRVNHNGEVVSQTQFSETSLNSKPPAVYRGINAAGALEKFGVDLNQFDGKLRLTTADPKYRDNITVSPSDSARLEIMQLGDSLLLRCIDHPKEDGSVAVRDLTIGPDKTVHFASQRVVGPGQDIETSNAK